MASIMMIRVNDMEKKEYNSSYISILKDKIVFCSEMKSRGEVTTVSHGRR